jgi:hypothetical protein
MLTNKEMILNNFDEINRFYLHKSRISSQNVNIDESISIVRQSIFLNRGLDGKVLKILISNGILICKLGRFE